MSDLLTDEELFAVTKAKRTSDQKRILDRNGIFYIERADNTIATTWHHVNHPNKVKKIRSGQPDNDGMPDFSKVRSG